MSNPIRMTAHKIAGALDFNEIDAEDKFVDAPSYDALAAELAAEQESNKFINNLLRCALHETAAELALRQTAEAYAARNALRVIELEASGNDLRASLVGMCHINDVMPDSVAERVKRFDDLFVTVPETACESRCAFDTNNGDRCILPDGHEGNHSL